MKKVSLTKIIAMLMLVIVMATALTACSCTKKHTVTMLVDGVETSVEMEKDAIPEKPADPVKEGFDFIGWFLDETGTNEYKFDTPLNEDATIYALFVEKEYKVTFVVDQAQETVTFKWSQTPTYGTPKKDGFVFKYWCKDAELTEEVALTVLAKEDATVYAKFAEAYKVQYVVSGTETPDIVETENDTIPVKPKDPVVEGYTFEGWFLDVDFTIPYNFDSVLEPETMVYAKLVEKEYVVTYMVGGTDVVISEETIKYFTIPTQPATPEYQGQYFFGWYLDAEFTNSYDFSYSFKKDTIVYAQFLESKPIYTLAELQEIKDYPAGNYTLMNNIIFSGHVWSPISTFSGKLDGNGFKLIALTLSETNANSGFIRTNNGTIKNLTIENYSFVANYTDSYVAGALVGTNNGTIENCHIIGLQSAHKMEKNTRATHSMYAGGIVGRNESIGVIKNCMVDGTASISVYLTNNQSNGSDTSYGYFYFGEVAGFNLGKIEKTFAKSTITGDASASGNTSGISGHHYAKSYLEIGGIVGGNQGVINQCGFDGAITAKATKGNHGYTYLYLGGVARINESTGKITKCYAKGSITETAGSVTETAIGGFAQNNSGEIKDSYADMVITTGTTLSNSTVGGFVSVNQKTISTCYATGSINSTVLYTGGFVASNEAGGAVNMSFCSVDVSSKSAFGSFVGYSGSGSTLMVCKYNSESTFMLNGAASTPAEVNSVSGLTLAELCASANLIDSLYWNTDGEIWVIDGENLPTLSWEV